jgi:tetratricopeptide (TPR) repeat protein
MKNCASLRQFSVFVRGFSCNDAIKVCGPQAPMGIEELCDNSLLRADHDARTQQTRFSMLESVRAYAEEKLDADANTREVTLNAHTTHAVDVAAEYTRKLRSRQDETIVMQKWAYDLDNIRAAMNRAQQHGQYRECAILGLSLGMFLRLRGFTAEATVCIESALDAALEAPETDEPLFIELLRERGNLHLDMLELDDAVRSVQEARTLSQQNGDLDAEGEALNLLGLIANEKADYAASIQYLESAMQCFNKTRNNLGRAKNE